LTPPSSASSWPDPAAGGTKILVRIANQRNGISLRATDFGLTEDASYTTTTISRTETVGPTALSTRDLIQATQGGNSNQRVHVARKLGGGG